MPSSIASEVQLSCTWSLVSRKHSAGLPRRRAVGCSRSHRGRTSRPATCLRYAHCRSLDSYRCAMRRAPNQLVRSAGHKGCLAARRAVDVQVKMAGPSLARIEAADLVTVLDDLKSKGLVTQSGPGAGGSMTMGMGTDKGETGVGTASNVGRNACWSKQKTTDRTVATFPA